MRDRRGRAGASDVVGHARGGARGRDVATRGIGDDGEFEPERDELLESEWFGFAWRAAFVALSVLSVVLITALFTPVVQSTLSRSTIGL